MPAVSKAERKDRARRLREAGARRAAAFLEGRVGRVERVLLEEPDDRGRLKGRSEHFAPVRVTGGGAVGAVLRARVTDIEGGCLVAEALA
jgi:threonylcarbamoyladenosine tRNA methylthiotransferase MtaB